MSRLGIGSTDGGSERRNKAATAATVIFPFGDEPRRIELVADWTVWVQEFDDHCVEGPALGGEPTRSAHHLLTCHKIANAPRAAHGSTDPYHLAWQDLWLRLPEFATPQQQARMLQGWNQWVAGIGCEIAYLAERRTPPLPEFMALRRYTFAANRPYCSPHCADKNPSPVSGSGTVRRPGW